MLLVKNLSTQCRETKKENQANNQSIKKLSNPNEKLKRKIDDCSGKDIKRKIVDKKLLDPSGILEEKSMF